jgi:hypothetical protein
MDYNKNMINKPDTKKYLVGIIGCIAVLLTISAMFYIQNIQKSPAPIVQTSPTPLPCTALGNTGKANCVIHVVFQNTSVQEITDKLIQIGIGKENVQLVEKNNTIEAIIKTLPGQEDKTLETVNQKLSPYLFSSSRIKNFNGLSE